MCHTDIHTQTPDIEQHKLVLQDDHQFLQSTVSAAFMLLLLLLASTLALAHSFEVFSASSNTLPANNWNSRVSTAAVNN
jgi:hypothetical protein